MTPKFIVIHARGTVMMGGLKHPPATILARSEDTIAIKVPSNYYQSGVRGLSRSYAPAETLVFRLLKSHGVDGYGFSGHGEGFDVELLLRWEHSRAKPEA